LSPEISSFTKNKGEKHLPMITTGKKTREDDHYQKKQGPGKKRNQKYTRFRRLQGVT
jgi:hypothetical protein